MTLLPRMHDGPIAEEGKWLDPMPRVYPLIPLCTGLGWIHASAQSCILVLMWALTVVTCSYGTVSNRDRDGNGERGFLVSSWSKLQYHYNSEEI
jgi:hypothetical protein